MEEQKVPQAVEDAERGPTLKDTISQERIKMATKEPESEAESGSSRLAHQRKESRPRRSDEVIFRRRLRWGREAGQGLDGEAEAESTSAAH